LQGEQVFQTFQLSNLQTFNFVNSDLAALATSLLEVGWALLW
jgi:hypothetical protein